MTPVVRLVLAVTVGAFFLQQVLPGFGNALVFVPAFVLVRPWTVLTYMLLHAGLGHLFFNMLALFFFGPRVEARLGSNRFLALYLISGATGALLSLALALGGVGSPAPIVGASGGVFGVSLAFAYYWPDEQILIWGIVPVPARILVVVTALISLWSGFGGRGGNVAHFAHLGGYLGAFLYLKWTERGRARFRTQATTAPKEAVRPVADYRRIDRGSLHELNREEVDRILDKISAKGVGSLTEQERLFLSNFVPMDDRKPT